MALTTARMAAALDTGLNAGAETQFFNTSSTEQTALRTATTLQAATNANPSVKASPSGGMTSPGASSGDTFRYFGFADSSHTLLTTKVQLSADVVLLTGGTISVANGALSEKLTQA